MTNNRFCSSDLPCIWTRNSVLIRRAASLSFSLLEPQRESISSMKMIEGLCSLARLKRFFTNLGSKRDVFKKVLSCLKVKVYTTGFSIILCSTLAFMDCCSYDLLFTLSQPFGDEVRRGDGEEGWVVCLCGNSFCQIGLSCTWGSKEQDPSPWSSFS